MNKFFIKSNLTLISKICLAGLFTAMATILQKVIAINYIPVVPFLRISLGGPAIIIFSSILLGPWFGLLVGAGSDILGYFALDMSGYAYFPQVTAIYALLGFLPYFVFCLVKFIKNKKIMLGVECGGLGLVLLLTSLYFIINNKIKIFGSTYNIDLAQKIAIPSLLIVATALVMTFIILYNKRVEKEGKETVLNAYQISFALFVIEIVVMVLFGTLMKAIAFGFATYPAIVISQIVVLFVNVPLNTVLITMLLRLTRKNFKTVTKE